ncbi:MAG TPA: hypothetical protein VL172_20500 [Kofleriaceae bacterium]|nr:hypothetical protein [Kofleriaceae bacterium]
MLRGAIALTVLTALTAPVFADDKLKALDETDEDYEKHQGQVGLHVKVGTGYRAIFRDADEYCGKTGEDLCNERAPVHMELGVAYRLLERLEAFFEVRVGLERDFGASATERGARTRAYMPGLKVYFKDAGTAKFWSSLAFCVDTTHYPQKPETDYGVKLTNAFQFDPHRTFGVFFYFGPVFAWQRWLRFELEGGLGIQARFP